MWFWAGSRGKHTSRWLAMCGLVVAIAYVKRSMAFTLVRLPRRARRVWSSSKKLRFKVTPPRNKRLFGRFITSPTEPGAGTGSEMSLSLTGSLVHRRASPLRLAPSRRRHSGLNNNTRGRTHVVRMGPPLPTSDLHGRAIGPMDAPVTLTAWLDYACPFSAKLFKTVTTQVIPHYGDKVRFVFYHQPQPWHPQSTMLHEAGVGVYNLGGVDAFWKFSAALFDTATDFYDANTYDKSRSQIYEELAALAQSAAGVPKADLLAKLRRIEKEGELNTGNECTQDLKFFVKLGRQTGIHVSPTTTLNGMVCDTSSGWSLDQWKEFLDPHVGE